MGNIAKWIVTAAAVILSACSTIHADRIGQGPPAKIAPNSPYLWTTGAAPQAHKDMVAIFRQARLQPGQYLWVKSIPAKGDTRIVVDRLIQMAYVYRGDGLVGVSTVSTAKEGHITPLGEWSVLEKRPFYRSKKYDDAPMPWMQRIDQYGIALHGGGTPGYPESHGCIHLPLKFAKKLYGLTKIGTKVVIEG